LIIATHNLHKTAEIGAILGAGFDLRDLTHFPNYTPPPESGSTFSQNAAIKALAASRALESTEWVLADDSGLEVEALEGAPGVRSARYAGVHIDDAANRARLLAELARVGARGRQRRARFQCALALARNGRIACEFDGRIDGFIANEEKGMGGFGYDSLFIPEGYCETFGQLDPAIKNQLSHRARALEKLRDFLCRLP
jgi:XTP/dITP diphosphohydrolase